MKIQSTETIHQGPIRAVIYAKNGYGKTSLAATVPNAFVLGNENGLRSLRGTKVAYTDLTKDENGVAYKTHTERFHATVAAIKNPLIQQYENVFFDTFTQFGYVMKGWIEENFAEEIKKNKFFLYSKIAETTTQLINYVNDNMKCNFILLMQEDLQKDEDQRQFFQPDYPGAASLAAIMGLHDEVYRLVVDDSIKDDKGRAKRWILTQPSSRFKAKTRGDTLPIEEADLGAIFKKLKENPAAVQVEGKK